MKQVIVLVLALALGTGCASMKGIGGKVGAAAAERVDLGDGLIFDLVPVGPAFLAADKAAPGSGAVLNMVESSLKSKREAKLGPFGGLPYTTERQVILKDGTIITQDKIAKIIRIRTPIVPSPVVDVVEPSDYQTYPTDPAPPTTKPPPVVIDPEPSAPATNAVITPASMSDILEAIGGAK